jgi:hypothetical protein
MPYVKKSERQPETIPCPIHKGTRAHEIKLESHPENPYLVIAKCGKRVVMQTAKRNVATVEALRNWLNQ